MNEQITLDVIPILENEMLPFDNQWFHYSMCTTDGLSKEEVIKILITQIKGNLYKYDALIVIEKGKVLRVIR